MIYKSYYFTYVFSCIKTGSNVFINGPLIATLLGGNVAKCPKLTTRVRFLSPLPESPRV